MPAVTTDLLPPEFIEDWWSIAEVDDLAQRCSAQPGLTVLDNNLPGSPAEEAFDARYGLVYALSTLLPDEGSGLFSFISLFRGEAQVGKILECLLQTGDEDKVAVRGETANG